MNQATMVRTYSEIQKRIISLKPIGSFVSCDNHSLNLVGVHMAHMNVHAMIFFETAEHLFTIDK